MSRQEESMRASVVARLNCELKRRRLTQEELAARLRVSRDSIKRLLGTGPGARKVLDLVLISKVAAELGISLVDLIGNPGRRQLPQPFDPRFDEPGLFADEFTEHLMTSRQFFAFHRKIGMQVTTKAVQDNVHRSMFGGISATDGGNKLACFYEKSSESARMIYLDSDPGDPIRLTYMLIEEDVAGFLNRDKPYDLCTPKEILECICHFREEGERRRGFKLLTISKKELERQPDLEFTIRGVDSLYVIGGGFTATRNQNHTISHSTIVDRVKMRMGDLQRLERIAKPVRLDEFEKQAERLVKQFEKGSPSAKSARP